MSGEDWFRDAVIYELHVRAFADSNGDGTGDFDGLTSRLDYLSDLGITAIWLLPFYPSPLRDDGYDIADYRTVNPDYGNLRAFRRFLDAAHKHNIKVITELVINHTSDQHPWFERARRAPAGSRHRDYYVWTDDPTQWSDARIIFQDFETSNWTWDPVAGQYYWHRFYSHQPDLNYDNPEVEAAVLDVLDHWFDMGVDGLRLDAVPYLYERDGTNCENLPETHDLLKRIRAHMDAKYEGRMLLAEANQWPEDAAAYFGDGDECHMNFHFPVMPRLFMSLQGENRMPIIDILDQTPTPPENCQWATFLRNHDELTLEMVTEEERHMMLRAYARDDEMRINLGIRRRLAPLLGNDRRKVELLNAVLFSLPGTPVVYYGDEIGMGDNVYLGDRDGVRTPMQWSSDRNGGFSTANPHRLYLPLITEQEYHYESVNVETQQSNPASLLSWMRQLIALRTRHQVLGRGDISFLDPDNPHVLAFVRHHDGEPPMLCVANLSRLAQHVELDLRTYQGATPVEVFGQNRFAPIRDNDYQVTLAPYGFFWLSLVGSRPDQEPVTIPHLPGSMPEVLRRRAGLGRALEQWLPQRRWFAGKGQTITGVSIDEAVVLDADGDVALLIVTLSFTEGDPQRYAVPVMRLRREIAEATDRAANAIAELDDGGLMIDAMQDAWGASAVIGAALRRRSRAGRHGEVRGRPRRNRISTLADDPRGIQVLGVEQSNSSAIVQGTLIAKLVRRLEAGLNPDVELPAHLRAAGFDRVPAVAATADVDLAGESLPANVVIVHDAVAHESDLWVKTLDDLGLAIDLGAMNEGRHDDVIAAHMAELLGQRTAELHRALARTDVSGTVGGDARAMAPEAFTLLWQRSLLQTLRNAVRATQRELTRARRSGLLTDAAVEQHDRLDAHVDELLGRFDRLRDTKLDAKRIRVHGDLHLGQVLWTGHDVVFIDFEGEPGAPMAQRSIKRSPLADVAGLIRSFDYAGRMSVHTAVERGRVAEGDQPALDAWRRGWTSQIQATLLDSYLAAIGDSGLIPADDDDRQLLVDIYVLVKALYEVRYELANRPTWVSWPMSAISDMLPGN
ncbi:MAG: maltose alpha-D-glucosyltransferase [Ilumatobacteraceae bacterium]